MINNEITLEYIADLVKNGFRYGHYPNWELSFNNINYNEVDDISLEYISKNIIDGFTQGEVITDSKNGWWYIKFE